MNDIYEYESNSSVTPDVVIIGYLCREMLMNGRNMEAMVMIGIIKVTYFYI